MASGDIGSVAIGHSASSPIFTLPAGPICTLTVVYVNGSHQAGLAAHDTWKSGTTWHWTWTVPSDAALVGAGKYQSVCTWAGQVHGNVVWYDFTVTAS